MKIARLFLWLVRVVVLIGFALFFGKYIRGSGPYLGHSTQLLPGFHETKILSGFNRPSTISIAPDGRVFLVEQHGTVRILQNDVLLPEPFVSIEVTDHLGNGMFHLVFDPDFSTNGFVYLYYVTPAPQRNRLSRVTAQGNVALPASLVTIWESPILTEDLDHHGGSPIFDENGYLYLGTGDTTSLTVARTGQTPTTPYGKILRFTRDGTPAPGNPFANVPGALPEVFALGFRNPFVLARNPVTGTILVNDVGQNDIEEINRLVPGGNYGWGTCEGDCNPPRSGLQDPTVSYTHGLGIDTGCAVASGVFYHPERVQFPAQYLDQYFYADMCSGWVRTLDLNTKTSTVFATGAMNIQDLDVAADGSLYYLTRGITRDVFGPIEPGQLWRVTYQPKKNQSCVVTNSFVVPSDL